MILICPSIPSPITELHLSHNLLTQEFLAPLCKKFGTKIALIADAGIAKQYGEKIAQELNAKLFLIPSGEEAKTRDSCKKLEDELFQHGFGKTSLLIALGGGATLDAVGFIASIYLRGVSLLLIPTTLLAMVDASVGGKTGIDTPFGKNLLGSIYHPKAIVADLSILKTLPQKEWQNGLAEIRKMGLIASPKIWNLPVGDELIIESIKAKIAIVEKDPTDSGLRRILNFGHTIGHGLEKLSQYLLPHGEAVAIGSLAAAHLSMQLGYLEKKDFSEIEATYKTFIISLPANYTREKLLDAMLHDKKAIDQQLRFVLIDRIGHAIEFNGHYCRHVSKEELLPTLIWMEQWFGR